MSARDTQALADVTHALKRLDMMIFDDWTLKKAEAGLETLGSALAVYFSELDAEEDDVLTVLQKLHEQFGLSATIVEAASRLLEAAESIDYTSETPEDVFEQADEDRGEIWDATEEFLKKLPA
jgi:hypothetical protein